jgi:hypothetical protein
LIAVACLAFAVVFTFAVVYPINAVLFQQAGGTHSASEVKEMAEQWILTDRVRFAVGIIAFLALLKAFRLPLPSAAPADRSS